MKAITFMIIGLSILFVACTEEVQITNFEECVAAGNPVMETYPRQCSDGENVFVEELSPVETTCGNLSLEEAKEISSNSECGSNFKETFTCNEGTNTFWLDLNTEKEGCNPACVINLETREAEINWRCTGLIPEETFCTMEYVPVCGEVQVQCITEPCNPVITTFSNKCEAEAAGAENIVEGVCEGKANPEAACLSHYNNWIEEAQECEGMSKTMCEDLGGTFNECASACRNDPDAQICTMQCVLVCEFE